MEWKWKDKVLRLIQGDIALLEVEAIVNAANKALILGGGVAGAIRRLGGPSIQEECDRLAPIQTGEAVLTRGGNLKAKCVIHAVGPVAGEGDEDRKLLLATENSLRIAFEKDIKSLAFPAISTGVFGFPIGKCSLIMLRTAMDFMRSHDLPREIIFCLYDQEAYETFLSTLKTLSQE